MYLKMLPKKIVLKTIMPDHPKKGDLLVWNWVDDKTKEYPHLDHYPVASVEDAIKAIEQLANEQLANCHVSANSFGLEVCPFNPMEDEILVDWEEWMSEDGLDIAEYTVSFQ